MSHLSSRWMLNPVLTDQHTRATDVMLTEEFALALNRDCPLLFSDETGFELTKLYNENSAVFFFLIENTVRF